MEMSWLETIEFIGLDLQAGLVLALFGLDVLERTLHSAWSAFSQRIDSRHTLPVAAPRVGIGHIQRI